MQWKTVICLSLALASLAGCGSRPDHADDFAKVRTLSLTPVIAGNLTDTGSRLEGFIQSATTRALNARGYAVGSEAEAQATVRVAWILGREIGPDGREERLLSLSLSIFSRAGDRLYSVRSAQNWPERMWSEDRAVTEVTRMLRDIPDCQSALVPAEGKPALAPIRLK